MNDPTSIVPSEDIRASYAEISSLCRKNPVVITVNGKEDTVLLNYECFMERNRYIASLEAKFAVYDHLAQAMDDVKLGRTVSADEAFDEVLDDLESLES